MKRRSILNNIKSLTSVSLLFVSIVNYSCNSFSAEFFEFLFNTTNIRVERECEDNPTFLEEGQYFEIYSMNYVDSAAVIKNIMTSRLLPNNSRYSSYKTPKWERTPVSSESEVLSFVRNELKSSQNVCFLESDLEVVLFQKGNYYTILSDNLGQKKVFIWATKQKQLFLLTGYET